MCTHEWQLQRTYSIECGWALHNLWALPCIVCPFSLVRFATDGRLRCADCTQIFARLCNIVRSTLSSPSSHPSRLKSPQPTTSAQHARCLGQYLTTAQTCESMRQQAIAKRTQHTVTWTLAGSELPEPVVTCPGRPAVDNDIIVPTGTITMNPIAHFPTKTKLVYDDQTNSTECSVTHSCVLCRRRSIERERFGAKAASVRQQHPATSRG